MLSEPGNVPDLSGVIEFYSFLVYFSWQYSMASPQSRGSEQPEQAPEPQQWGVQPAPRTRGLVQQQQQPHPVPEGPHQVQPRAAAQDTWDVRESWQTDQNGLPWQWSCHPAAIPGRKQQE